MTVSFTFTPEDIQAFFHYYLTMTEDGRRSTRRVYRFRLALAVIVTLLIAWAGKLLGLHSPWILALFAGVPLAGWTVAQRNENPKMLAQSMADADIKKHGQSVFWPKSIWLDERGLHWKSDQGGKFARFGAIAAVVVTPTHAFVTWNSDAALAGECFIIPRRAFGSDDAFQAFVAQLNSARAKEATPIAGANWWTQGKAAIESESSRQPNRLGNTPPS